MAFGKISDGTMSSNEGRISLIFVNSGYNSAVKDGIISKDISEVGIYPSHLSSEVEKLFEISLFSNATSSNSEEMEKTLQVAVENVRAILSNFSKSFATKMNDFFYKDLTKSLKGTYGANLRMEQWFDLLYTDGSAFKGEFDISYFYKGLHNSLLESIIPAVTKFYSIRGFREELIRYGLDSTDKVIPTDADFKSTSYKNLFKKESYIKFFDEVDGNLFFKSVADEDAMIGSSDLKIIIDIASMSINLKHIFSDYHFHDRNIKDFNKKNDTFFDLKDVCLTKEINSLQFPFLIFKGKSTKGGFEYDSNVLNLPFIKIFNLIFEDYLKLPVYVKDLDTCFIKE